MAGVAAECERILRSLPRWFGIESALAGYVRDTQRFPTFGVLDEGRLVAFLTIREHFPMAWEVHCMAVQSDSRGRGIGRALHDHVENWLAARGVRFLQVKTLSADHPSREYAETRGFYSAIGYVPLEIFPQLWGPSLPVLQLVKAIPPSAA